MPEKYFVIKFESGTYYDGTRYSANNLKKAKKFNTKAEAEKMQEKIWQKTIIKEIEIKEL